jgi:hypothetical protein
MDGLFILVSIFPQLLLAFVGRNLPQFAFSSAGHSGVSLESTMMDPCSEFAPVCSSRVKRSRAGNETGRNRNEVSFPAGEFRGGYVLFEGSVQFEYRETPAR